ncbi:lactoylglutathione lyase [uncultured Psychromonas sp.]|uniref:lactoylglutathione lyase n=1 Tax=uncultured Psychromonas sp. TaxID=173974 RepID=UPI00261FE981|nr:lactoylglutathione lyase [uncultured Psychromonas sp.]
MRFLHTMVRVKDLEKSMHFYCDLLGLVLVKKNDYEKGQFSLIYLTAPENIIDGTELKDLDSPLIELTYNWEPESYTEGRNFGHLAFEVDDIYALCEKLQAAGVIINRPPRDGHMAFVRSPDNISIELLQKGKKLAAAEPWASMENTGTW